MSIAQFDEMSSQWVLLFLSVFLCDLTQVFGLKCYICDSGMDGCVVDVILKPEYLIDCDPRAIGCAIFRAETKNYNDRSVPDSMKEVWIQRTCLYPRDLQCFDLDGFDLPGKRGLLHDNYGFVDQIGYANTFRTEDGLPLMKEPPVSSLIRDKLPLYLVQTCESQDGCNHWDKDSGSMFPYAEDFPIHEHNTKKTENVSCYSCNTNDNPYCSVKQTSSAKKDISSEGYGCAMLSIYKIEGGLGRSSYFERDVWYPGDHFCLQKSSSNGRSSENPVKYGRFEDEPCDAGEYERALKEGDKKTKHYWIGQREFGGVEEFNTYLLCREQVKMKLGISGGFELKFNEDEAHRNYWQWGSNGYNSFAFVGFRFCGPNDLCNDWSDHKLYEAMKNAPTTTTDASVTTTTPPTKKNSTKGGEGGGVNPDEFKDGCRKDRNNSIKKLSSLPSIILPSIILLTFLLSEINVLSISNTPKIMNFN